MFSFIFIFLILIDQSSKYFFEHFLSTQKIHLIEDFLVLSFVKNTGIAFSFQSPNYRSHNRNMSVLFSLWDV